MWKNARWKVEGNKKKTKLRVGGRKEGRLKKKKTENEINKERKREGKKKESKKRN